METRVICSEMYLTSQELQNFKSKMNPKTTFNVDIEVENKTSEEQQTVTNSNSNDPRTKETKSKLKPEVVDGPILNKVRKGIPKAMMTNMKNSQEFRKSSERAGSHPMEEKFGNSKSSKPLAQWKIIFTTMCLMLYYMFS